MDGSVLGGVASLSLSVTVQGWTEGCCLDDLGSRTRIGPSARTVPLFRTLKTRNDASGPFWHRESLKLDHEDSGIASDALWGEGPETPARLAWEKSEQSRYGST